MYEERAEQIPYIDVLSYSQLIQILKGPAIGKKHRTFADIANEYLSQIDEEDRAKSYKLYRLAVNKYLSYAGENSLMEQVTPLHINNYIMSLQKSKLSSTTINIYNTPKGNNQLCKENEIRELQGGSVHHSQSPISKET